MTKHVWSFWQTWSSFVIAFCQILSLKSRAPVKPMSVQLQWETFSLFRSVCTHKPFQPRFKGPWSELEILLHGWQDQDIFTQPLKKIVLLEVVKGRPLCEANSRVLEMLGMSAKDSHRWGVGSAYGKSHMDRLRGKWAGGAVLSHQN